jgi:hypothetical protein
MLMSKRAIGRIAVVVSCVAGLLGTTAIISRASAAPPSGFLTVFVNPAEPALERTHA